jgi:hypothetical protein
MTIFELLICPFCGRDPQVSNCVDYSVIHCSCGIRSRENREGTNTKERIQTLVDEWNNRITRKLTDLSNPLDKTSQYIYREWGEYIITKNRFGPDGHRLSPDTPEANRS